MADAAKNDTATETERAKIEAARKAEEARKAFAKQFQFAMLMAASNMG